MKPQIEFRHVLGELSVNRNDPCEVLRELVSNSYDAEARHLWYAPLIAEKSFIFLDDGVGLSSTKKTNGITPWEAFFSIGKSTKKKGSSIGYKCQGSKLCFASSRIFVATKTASKKQEWEYKIVDNPRNNLDVNYDITPKKTSDLREAIESFYPSLTAESDLAVSALFAYIDKSGLQTGTLIIIDEIDTEGYGKYFSIKKKIEESYVFNYIRFFTRHGDVRRLDKKHGFTQNQITQVSSKIGEAEFVCFANKKSSIIPHGFPYLEKPGIELDIKSPAQVSRLRDGRFFSRAAKTFQVGSITYSIVMAIDGNRRAHEEYQNLDRKGKAKSGVRLGDQRGLFISVNGIKICKYLELLETVDEYRVMTDGDSSSHFCIIIDGEFDLVTNRNSLSKKAFDTLHDPEFVKEIKKFLDAQKKTDIIFAELLSRLKRESTENKLNEQMEILEASRERLKKRERFRINADGKEHLFLSPMAGEEYLVGVLYAILMNLLPHNSSYAEYWKKILTFSTQGIDSLGVLDENANAPLKGNNIISVEYKYDFNNSGPFNHAIAVVNYIVAWEVTVDVAKKVVDSYTCFGNIKKCPGNDFEWEIYDIESDEGAIYQSVVRVICLKDLIKKSFSTKFVFGSD